MVTMDRTTTRRLFVVALLLLAVGGASAQIARAVPGEVDLSRSVLLFHSETCPYCHDALRWMERVQDRYPGVPFYQLEVDANRSPADQAYFREVMADLGSGTNGWPRMVIDGRVYIGFAQEAGPLEYVAAYGAYMGYQSQIEESLIAVARRVGSAAAPPVAAPSTFGSSAAAVAGRVAGIIMIAGALIGLIVAGAVSLSDRRRWAIRAVAAIGGAAGLFLLGATLPAGAIAGLADRIPFPVFVAAVALADGFNPCAFTVLFVLLSLLTYTKRRSAMIVIGSTFVLASGVVYFAFIMILVAAGTVAIAQFGYVVLRIVGAGVIIVGLLSVKDAIAPGVGPSTGLTAKQRRAVTARSRRIVESISSERLGVRLLAIGGTAVLALAVNAVELGCTAILPTVYLGALVSRAGTAIGVAHVAWTAFYAAIYIAPMVLIVGSFVFVFRSRKVQVGEGRALRLVGGVVMGSLGAIMVINPALLAF